MIRRWAHADADYTTLAPRFLIAADPKSQDSQPWRQQPPPTHTTKGPTARSARPEITARERNPAPHESSPSTARAHARCSSARAINPARRRADTARSSCHSRHATGAARTMSTTRMAASTSSATSWTSSPTSIRLIPPTCSGPICSIGLSPRSPTPSATKPRPSHRSSPSSSNVTCVAAVVRWRMVQRMIPVRRGSGSLQYSGKRLAPVSIEKA
jgi:hypothetical protein